MVRAASVQERQGAVLRRRARRRSRARERQRRESSSSWWRKSTATRTIGRCSKRCGRTSRPPSGMLETLRQSERTDANLASSTRAFYGLMPASISHEGYSEKPMHSYWDDFWMLKGYEDAASIATTLGHMDAASRIGAQRDEFRRDLNASLQASIATHGIEYLPGSAELGDFDPTSTTIAFAPRGDLARSSFSVGAIDLRALLARVRRPPRRQHGVGRLHALRACATSARSYAWGGAIARRSCSRSFSQDAGPRRGTNGPKWSAAIRAKARFVGDMPHALGGLGLHRRGARPLRLRAQ